MNDARTDGFGRTRRWAFHFLVDVATGRPLRLYGPYGVRQVFREWTVDDVDPGLFEIPKHCLLVGEACRSFAKTGDS